MVEDVSVKAATPDQVIDWVQLMNKLPVNNNPMNDEDGGLAELGDVGETHYLAGTMGGHADRAFDVDLGDTLVLPMLNAWEWILGDYDNLKDAARSFFDSGNPNNAWLKVDLGNDSKIDFEAIFDLKNSTYYPELDIRDGAEFYVESGEEFKLSVPKNNINGDPPIILPGVYDAYAVGYWAQIDDLPKGMHKIEFGGTFAPKGYDPLQISITDTITVGDSSDDYLL